MNDSEIYIKTVLENESIMHQKIQKIIPNLSPKIYDIRVLQNDIFEITMEKLPGTTIAEYFGEKSEKTPEYIWEQIRNIVKTLLDNDIEYFDISPYNFIYDDVQDIVRIIDFGGNGVMIKSERTIENWYIEELLNGLSEWNPDMN
jgi:serine/threonine protein kinase